MKRRYAGILDVENEAFTLNVRDLRVFDRSHVAFDFSGEDDGGPFECADVAKFSKGTPGFYVAQAKLKASRKQIATIRFMHVKEQDGECTIRGEWEQDGYEGSPWEFFGVLDVIEKE